MQTPVMQVLRWMRVRVTLVFALGAVVLVWCVLTLIARIWRQCELQGSISNGVPLPLLPVAREESASNLRCRHRHESIPR